MIFATLHDPRWKHYLECAHLRDSARSFGVTAFTVNAWDSEGRLAHREDVPLELGLWPLAVSGPGGEIYFVTIETTFTPEEFLHVYGYIHSGGDDGAAVYYPLNMTMGSHHVKVWDNVGHFVWGAPSLNHRLRLFVANPSRWATVEGVLTALPEEKEGARRRIELGPKRCRVLDLWDGLDPAPEKELQGIEFVSSSKLVTYVFGEDRKTGGITFVEHLFERWR
jgi:hypothetical protein